MNCKYVANASAHTLHAHTQTHTQTHPHTHVHSFWFLNFYTVLSYTGIMQCQSYFAIAFIVACCRHRHRQRQRQTTWQRWRQHSELGTGIVVTAEGGEKGRGSWSCRQDKLRQKPITTTTSSKQLLCEHPRHPGQLLQVGHIGCKFTPLRPAQDIYKSIISLTLVLLHYSSQMLWLATRNCHEMQCHMEMQMQRGNDSVYPSCKPQVGVARACPDLSVCLCV